MSHDSESASSSPQSFEEALSALEKIIRSLEFGQTSLDDSLKYYEQGIRLLRYCHATLKNAERKIEILSGVDEDGSLQTASVSEEEFSTKAELFGEQTSQESFIIRKKRVKKKISKPDHEIRDSSLFDQDDL